MNVTRTVLLGAAAGIVAASAATAADLPMTKAEPVEYVKVCTEFGAGFFYIPGTDTCLKISGEIRADYAYRGGKNFVRGDDRTAFATRAKLNFDARTQTEFGVLRSFVSLKAYGNNNEWKDGGATRVTVDKAYIQFGGLTAGFAHSFFGFYDAEYGNTIFAGYYGEQNSGVNLLAYTAVFGGGFSATLSVEDGVSHRTSVTAIGAALGSPRANAGYGGHQLPDLVANLRVDQGWGKAEIMGAVHQIRFLDDTVGNNKYGYAVGGSLAVNLPVLAGSYIALEGAYASGASEYLLGGVKVFRTSATIPDAVYLGTESKRVNGWQLTGELGVNFTPAVTARLFGSIVDFQKTSIGDFTRPGYQSYWLGGNVWYTIVKGLSVGAEIAYNKETFKSTGNFSKVTTDQWVGGMRIKRTF